MNPIIEAGLILLALTVVLAVIGVVLVRLRKLRLKTATRYTQLSTAIVWAATYFLAYSDWSIVHLRTLDFWSLMIILGIISYSVVWAALAYQLNKAEFQQEYGESFMLSMLYTDSQHPDMAFPATKVQEKRDPPPQP